MRTRGRRLALVLGVATLAPSPPAPAQELEPRSFANAPVGLNFLVAGYGYTSGNVLTDATLPIKDGEIRANGGFIGYARTLDVLGRSGKFDIVLPVAAVSGSATFEGQPHDREITGLADPRVRFAVDLYGAPALTMAQFAGYHQDLIVGASVQVSVPLGQYDDEKLLNLGTNRWTIKSELALSKAWGPLTLELSGATTFFTDNDDYFGGKTREQDPLLSFQSHLVYSFRRGIWAALDANYYVGGRTTVGGVLNSDLERNSRLGFTVAVPITRQQSLKAYASTGVSTRTGTDFDIIGIIWQYRWASGP